MPTLEHPKLPLYYQLMVALKEQIYDGHLAPGAAIPSEFELAAHYHVSRATVRQAVTALVNEGLLERQHGRGTFVCEKKATQQNDERDVTLSISEFQHLKKIEEAARIAFAHLSWLDDRGDLTREEQPMMDALREALTGKKGEE